MSEDVKTIKYILYARKSSEEDSRQMLSLDSQVSVLKEIAERDSLSVIEILREARSAKEPSKRPVFSQMIKTIESGKANGILCWKVDRLARNPIEEGVIKWLLQTGKIQRIKTPERDYRPEDNALIASVEFGMANQYIRDLSTNVRRGLHEKAKRGLFPTLAPIGYINDPHDPKGDKKIIPDPKRFALIRKIFDLILEGHYTPAQAWRIARNDWKLTTIQGALVSRCTIYRLLTSPLYCGVFEYPVGSGNWHKGRHKPMITEEEYDKIQVILGKEGKPRPRKHAFAFTGLMRCGECGAMITAEDKVKCQKNGNVHTYIYYRCTKRINPTCSQKCLEEKKLKEQIAGRLDRLYIPPEFHEWAMKWMKKEVSKDVSSIVKIKESQEKRLEECKNKLNRLIDMRAGGELGEEQFRVKNAEYTKEIMRLEGLLAQSHDRTETLLNKVNEHLTLARDAKDEFEDGGIEKRRRIVVKLGSNPTLKDRILNICVEKPLLLLEGVAKEVRAIHTRLEPLKISVNKKEIERLYARNLIVRWG